MCRYWIRGAQSTDEDGLLELASHLNSVNLPNSRPHVRKLLELSEASFSGAITEPSQRRFTFVLEDSEQQTLVGTSSIVAQLGTPDAPYIFLDVLRGEKYSRTLRKHFHHTLLRLGLSYDGPTELGGLVVHPAYRKAPERLGVLISYVRFLFIAMHRALFREELLAELLPPLEADGTSHLWEALGRHFTGLSYAEADLLSSQNKDFIVDLFPTELIYASVLSERAQAVIGKVGEQTRGVEKMLKRVGFRYANRIDPFDGGPHFVARTAEVSLIRDVHQRTLEGFGTHASPSSPLHRHLVAVSHPKAPYFQAALLALPTEPGLELAPSLAARLGLSIGDEAHLLALA